MSGWQVRSSTARPRKDESRNGRQNTNENPECSLLVSFQAAHLTRNLNFGHSQFWFVFRWPFQVSSFRERVVSVTNAMERWQERWQVTNAMERWQAVPVTNSTSPTACHHLQYLSTQCHELHVTNCSTRQLKVNNCSTCHQPNGWVAGTEKYLSPTQCNKQHIINCSTCQLNVTNCSIYLSNTCHQLNIAMSPTAVPVPAMSPPAVLFWDEDLSQTRYHQLKEPSTCCRCLLCRWLLTLVISSSWQVLFSSVAFSPCRWRIELVTSSSWRTAQLSCLLSMSMAHSIRDIEFVTGTTRLLPSFQHPAPYIPRSFFAKDSLDYWDSLC